MIDLSSLKTPGWQRVVAELNSPSPDDRTFLHKLVAVLAQVSGSRQGVLFAVEREGADQASAPEPRPIIVWPPPATGDQAPQVERPGDARSAARAAADSGQIQIFGLEQSGGGFYEEQDKGYIVAVPVQSDAPHGGSAAAPKGVVTLLIEQRSRQALQTTTAMIEVLAGYTHLHAARQQLKKTRAATAALDLAGRLISSVNTARTFKGAAFQLVNDLSRQMRADRVAMGWVRGLGASGAVRVVAVSDTEMIDRRMAMIQKLQAAMDECLDQEQAVLYPPPPAQGDAAADVVLSQAITHAHRDLAASDARLKVVSLPLRDGDKVVGVVTIESTAEGPADIASIELVQAALDLVAPVLLIRRSDDRSLAARTGVWAVKTGAWAVGPKHTGWKLVALLVMIAAMAVTFVHAPYRVEAQIELQPRVKFIVAVPFDGVLDKLPEGIEAGRRVKKGDTLVMMNIDDVELRITQAQSEKVQARAEADAYLKSKKLAEAEQATARAEQADARLRMALLDRSRARIISPIDGTIIAGDLSDKIGAAVKLGDVLFQVAPIEDMVVLARVSDRDIGLVHGEESESGPTSGEIATRAYPARTFPFTVERIVPLAEPKDGQNVFEVRGALKETAPWLRPGMEGIAKFDTGRHSLLWIGTRRIRDQLRLWLWW